MPPIASLRNIPSVTSIDAAESASPLPQGTAGALSATGPSALAGADDVGGTSGHGRLDNASIMCNLLPNLGQTKEPSQSRGIYVGEGLLPVPAKLAEKITRWKFVEMCELLPEFWSSFAPKDPTSRGYHVANVQSLTLPHGYNASPLMLV